VLGQWQPYCFENKLNCCEVRKVDDDGGGDDDDDDDDDDDNNNNKPNQKNVHKVHNKRKLYL
jgi:hypothetical protein